MDIQSIIVMLFLVGSIAYAGLMFYRKVAAFSPAARCSDDCGCSGSNSPTPRKH